MNFRQISLTFVLLASVLTASAQERKPRANALIVPLEEETKIIRSGRGTSYRYWVHEQDVYLKDTKGELMPFVGYWRGEAEGKLYEFFISRDSCAYITSFDEEGYDPDREKKYHYFSDKLRLAFRAYDKGSDKHNEFMHPGYTEWKAGHYHGTYSDQVNIYSFGYKSTDPDNPTVKCGDLYFRHLGNGEGRINIDLYRPIYAPHLGFNGKKYTGPHIFPRDEKQSQLRQLSASPQDFSRIRATKELAYSSSEEWAEKLLTLMRFYAWGSRLLGQQEAQGLEDIILSRGSLEYLDTERGGYQTQPGGWVALFRPQSPGSTSSQTLEIRLSHVGELPNGLAQEAGLLRALVHATLIRKLEALGRQNDAVARHLRETNYCGDDFASLFDYYASVLGVSPLELAREYERDAESVLSRLLPQELPTKPLVWAELRGSAAWRALPERERGQLEQMIRSILGSH